MNLIRTLLFVPAVNERMITNAARSDADAVILDLEDGVAGAQKADARQLARTSIAALRDAGKTALVRVNGIETGATRDDLLAVIADGLTAVVLPKVQHPQDLRDLDVLLREAEVANGVRPGDIAVVPIIESARAVLRCEPIVQAIDRVAGIAIGGEDYTRDIGVERDADGLALMHIRGATVQIATAYGLTAIDAPYIDFKDERGLIRDSEVARAIGLKAKFVIHPDQVATANRIFSPSEREVAQARRIVDAWETRDAAVGAISVDGRMVDAPVFERARQTIATATSRSTKTAR